MDSINATPAVGTEQSDGPSDHLAALTSALDRITTHAASLPPKSDLSFHRTLDRSFAKSLDATSLRLLGLTEQLLTLVAGDLDKQKPGVKGKGRSHLVEEQDAVEGFRRSVGSVVDGLCEDADSNLDEVSGQKKAPAIEVDPAFVAAASRKLPGPFAPNGPSGKHAGPRLAQDIMFANIPKPQLLFPDTVNTAHNQPWTPTLSEKPHSMVPLNHPISTADIPSPSLATDVKDFEFRKKKIKERAHPYWYETQHLPYPTRMFEVAPPIPPMDLDECPLTFVDTPEALEEMVTCLKEAKEIAVDLEHHSWRSYFGFTCLMQISTRERDWVVDTLKLRGEIREGKLGNVMTDPNIVKVFHGSDSDIIWLERDFDIYIVNLFDTYHATNVLNHPSHSLAALLARYCNFTADKRYQMADWRIRPLPQEMIDYARSDTHYLLYIYDNLRNALLEMSSRPTTPQPETSAETSESRSAEALQTAIRQNPQAALRKTLELSAETALKLYEREEYSAEGTGSGGWRSLLRKTLPKDSEDTIEAATLIALHKWRDDLAREQDESVFWVMPTNTLGQIGVLRVPTLSMIDRLCKTKHMLAKGMASQILKVVKAARKQWTDNPPPPVIKSSTAPSGEHTKFGSEPIRKQYPVPSRPSGGAVVAADLAATKAKADSLWASIEAGPSTGPMPVKPKSRSALFGNTVTSSKSNSSPSNSAPPPSTKSKSSMFGSTLRATAPTSQVGPRPSSTFDEVNRRIAAGIAPSVASVAGGSGTAAVSADEAGAGGAVSENRMEPENVPFVPANQRAGFATSAQASTSGGQDADAVMAQPVPVPAAKKRDEIVKVKRQRQKAGKVAAPTGTREASSAVSSSSTTASTSGPIPIDIDGDRPQSIPTPKGKSKKTKAAPGAQASIPDFDYATEGNLLDHPNAAPREEADDGHKKKKKKKDKKSRVDAPPPVNIQTPDFGKMPRDMSQPKAGARSRTFTS